MLDTDNRYGRTGQNGGDTENLFIIYRRRQKFSIGTSFFPKSNDGIGNIITTGDIP